MAFDRAAEGATRLRWDRQSLRPLQGGRTSCATDRDPGHAPRRSVLPLRVEIHPPRIASGTRDGSRDATCPPRETQPCFCRDGESWPFICKSIWDVLTGCRQSEGREESRGGGASHPPPHDHPSDGWLISIADEAPRRPRYSSAVASTGLATVARLALDPFLGARFPFVTYYAAVLFTAWYGGAGPAILAVVLGSLLSGYLFIAPLLSFRVADDAALGLALFNAAGLVRHLLHQGPPGRSGAAGAGGGAAVPGGDREA